MSPDVSIIVSNRNGVGFLVDCLASLHGAGRPQCRHEIVVTDNASSDGSVEAVRSRYPDVRVIAHERDLGFLGSNNKAIASTRARYVHLLNNDTIVLPGAIDRLVAFLDGTERAGVVGNRLVYPDGREQHSGRRFPTPANAIFGRRSVLSRWLPDNRWVARYTFRDELRGDTPFEVDWVSAAAAMYRRAAIDDVGPMDESWYYWHEAAWCLTMKLRGWNVYLHPNAWVIHHEGLGSGQRVAVVRGRHHLDFARGSFRFYCRYRELGAADPRRWLAALGLYGRAAVLTAASALGLDAGRRAPEDIDGLIRGAYGRLLQQLLSAEKRGQVLLLTSVTGGEGVTSTAATLGQELARRADIDTLLVDANPDHPALHRMFWAENRGGFSELVSETHASSNGLVQRIGPHLALVPHGQATYNLMAAATRERLAVVLRQLAASGRFVLIDAPPLDQRTDALALAPQVDGVILVVRAEAVDREQVRRAAADLRAAGGTILGAVYNGKRFHIPEAIYRRV